MKKSYSNMIDEVHFIRGVKDSTGTEIVLASRNGNKFEFEHCFYDFKENLPHGTHYMEYGNCKEVYLSSKPYELKYCGKKQKVKILVRQYPFTKNLAIQLNKHTDADTAWPPFAVITKNFCEAVLPKDLAYVDTNNCPWAEQFITENGIGVSMQETLQSGYCTYPLYKFFLDNLNCEKPQGGGK